MAAFYTVAVASALAEQPNTAPDACSECRHASVPQYPRDDEHVRSAQSRVVAAIRDALSRSPTFGRLLTTLDGSDVVVYVELARKMPTGMDGYFAHWVVLSGGYRYVHIFVDFELAQNRLIETIAHELQHAIEFAQAPDVRTNDAMRELFQRLDSGRCVRGCTETDAAIAIQKAVARELRAQHSTDAARGSRKMSDAQH